ncbi:MAG: NUDIX hydrolase [Nocardioidaceae bacterium]
MPEFTWHAEAVPAELLVRQVYGFCFDSAGRLLMRVDGSKHSLPGGRPESGEEDDYETTLRRECWEEVHIDLDQPYYLGYQRVDESDGTAPYAQVRMIALIRRIAAAAPDPDNGKTYGRHLVDPAAAGDLLGWGVHGHRQAEAAARLAQHTFDLPVLT